MLLFLISGGKKKPTNLIVGINVVVRNPYFVSSKDGSIDECMQKKST